MTRSHASAMLAPGAGGNAVHGGNHRHRQLPQAHDQWLVAALDRFAEIDAGAARGHGPIAQILACAESSARAGDDQYARSAVAARAVDRVAYFFVHRDVEAVEPVGPVKRQPRYAAAQVEENVLVAHGSGFVVSQLDLGSLWVRLAGEDEALLQLPVLERVVLRKVHFATDELGAARGTDTRLA